MFKEIYHPNAYLVSIKNTRLGLKARTRILNALERHSGDAGALSKETEMTYGVVLHHLKRLKEEGIVCREGKRPYIWTLSGLGQKRLIASD